MKSLFGKSSFENCHIGSNRITRCHLNEVLSSQGWSVGFLPVDVSINQTYRGLPAGFHPLQSDKFLFDSQVDSVESSLH